MLRFTVHGSYRPAVSIQLNTSCEHSSCAIVPTPIDIMMQFFLSVILLTMANTVLKIDALSVSCPSFDRKMNLFSSSHKDIEPYIGPVGSIGDMEGGIAVGELALNVLAGPSLVSSGMGLFLCIHDDIDPDSNEEGAVEEIIIPQGTPLCGYARGYFTDQQEGDKSVGFLFKENSADVTAVFYNQQLMTLGDAIWSIYEERRDEKNTESGDFLFGHHVKVNAETYGVELKADKEFLSRIFIPDTPEGSKFAATSLGVYANDLAYDPDATEEQYFETSESNNILQLVWRLAKDENSGSLVPTWPVVVTRKDVRLVNTVPMEVGLQYGYNYWDAVAKEGTSKYISE